MSKLDELPPGPHGRRHFVMDRIAVPKASSVLAGHLRESILTRALQAGTLLPNERELAEKAGLSRTSVREALRMLEVEGLVSTRTGRNGGSVAQIPSHAALEKAIHLFIRGQRVRFQSMVETREAIEPASARLAALRRTDEDLAALQAIHDRMAEGMDDLQAFLTTNVEWHLAVVTASHNELMIGFMRAISTVILTSTDIAGFNSDAVRAAVLRAHGRVLDAIRGGDADGAHRRMARHLQAYVAAVADQAPAVVTA
jgi:GntR family transcriptional repressor for pyruvate dehydrogenase complex